MNMNADSYISSAKTLDKTDDAKVIEIEPKEYIRSDNDHIK